MHKFNRDMSGAFRSAIACILLVLVGCNGGGTSSSDMGSSKNSSSPSTGSPSGDQTLPSVSITSPSSSGSYTTSASSVTVSGTASDNVGVTQVSWLNNRGGSGTANGMTSWSAANLTLQSGANLITVTARDAAGNTKSTSITVTYNSLTVPPAPTGFSASAGNAQVTLGWNTVTGATGYKVYRGANLIASPTVTTFTDTGLTNSTSYTYQVSAINSVGEGAKSSAVTATPTSSGLQTHCESNPSQCGYPDATNTGIPAGTSLTLVNGDMTISTAGAVIDGKDIRGCVTVTAPGVTIRRSKITCGGFYTIHVTSNAAANGAARLLIEDVELINGDNTTAIAAQNITAHRVYSRGGENGGSFDNDVTIEDSFITGIMEVNGGHGDGIQIGGSATNILINHNTILVHDVTSAINWTDQTVSMTVQNNLLAGGNYTLYCPRVAVPSGAFKTLNNRFGTYTYGHTDSCGNTGQVFTGNYSDADLSPISP